MSNRVFISYGHDEYAVLAERLKQDLESLGHEVWFDLNRLKPGGDWERYIEEGFDWVSEIPGEGHFVLLLTPHSVRRPNGYCLNELARALDRKLRVIPLMVVRCEPPLSIARIQWLGTEDCLPLPEREAQYQLKLSRLLEALEHDSIDFDGVQRRLLQRLQPLSFVAEIQQHVAKFTGRKWLLNRINGWLADRNASRVFWITGKPGVGKTAVACWLSLYHPEVAAFHLCHHDHAEKSDARRAILSIAFQLSTQLPDYQERLNVLNLEELVANGNAKSLFDNLVVQPLSPPFQKPQRLVVIIIDALDEATMQGENELATIIGSGFESTPDWMRLILTSRPEPMVTNALQSLTPCVLDDTHLENQKDLKEYLAREIQPYVKNKEVLPELIEKVVNRSEGLFLYVEWIRKELNLGRLDLHRIDEFPQGLGGIYAQFFNRQFADVNDFKKRFRPVLETVVAAQEALEMKYLSALFDWSEYDEEELGRAFGSLFPISNGRIQPFHLTVLEWLSNKKKAGRYFVSVGEGHRRLAAYGWKKLTDYRLAAGDRAESGLSEQAPAIRNLQDGYSLRYLTAHLEEADRVRDLHNLLRFEQPVGKRIENLWYAIRIRIGQRDGYLRDLERARALAKITKAVGLQIRYALCLTSVRATGNIPLPLLEIALRYDFFTWQQALDLALLYRESEERAQSLCRLAPLLPDTERISALTHALDIARTNQYTHILSALVPHLPEPLLDEVLEVSTNTEQDDSRAHLLSAIAARLPEQVLDAVVEAAKSIDTPLQHLRVLRSVGLRLSGAQCDRLLKDVKATAYEIVDAVPEGADKVLALCEIAGWQESIERVKLTDRALLIARKLDYSDGLAVALKALAYQDLTNRQLAESLEIAAQTFAEEDHPGTLESYASVLFAFGPLLSSNQRTNIIGKFVSELWPARFLIIKERNGLLSGILGLYLPREQQIRLFPDLVPYLIRGAKSREWSLFSTRRRTMLKRDWKREAALMVLSQLSGDTLKTALHSATQVYNDDDRADILYALVPRLRQDLRLELLAEEITRAQFIDDTEARTWALTTLAGYMPEDQRAELAESTLNAAQTMKAFCFKATAKLAPYLEGNKGDEVVRQALLAIRHLSESRSRMDALMALIPVLPESSISKALEIAEGLDTADYSALAALVPRLAVDKRHDIIDKCLNTVQGWGTFEIPEDFVQALRTLAPDMDKTQQDAALKISRNLPERERADAIVVLAPWLGQKQLDKAFAIAHMLPHDEYNAYQRAKALASLAPHLTEQQRSTTLSETLKAINDSDIPGIPIGALAVLAPQLQEDEQIEALSKALSRAKTIEEDDRRAEKLCGLLPLLSKDDRLDALQQLLNSCMGTKVVLTIGGKQIRRGIEREFLLERIASIAGTLADMGGERVVAETVSAIRDTAAWWP